MLNNGWSDGLTGCRSSGLGDSCDSGTKHLSIGAEQVC